MTDRAMAGAALVVAVVALVAIALHALVPTPPAHRFVGAYRLIEDGLSKFGVRIASSREEATSSNGSARTRPLSPLPPNLRLLT